MKLQELVTEAGYSGLKAGIVPFLDDGRALFAVSSNAAFGGSDPAIAKGRVDYNEDSDKAAVREGGEELGLIKDNMAAEPFLGWSGEISGLDATYPFKVYAVLVKNEKDFDDPDHETAHTVWMSRAKFMKEGRKSHREIMTTVFDKIDEYLKKNK